MVRHVLARPALRLVPAVLFAFIALTACDRNGPVDSVEDTAADARVWLDDARKISATLPARIGAFDVSDAAAPFFTSYSTGPVFGSSCTYAHDGRQLVVRIESGNIRSRAASAFDAGTGGGARAGTVHGYPALIRWGDISRVGEVTLLVARRYLVDVRLVPANGDAEVIRLAESLDTGALEALVLEGVAR
jgi:hypothetical protein